MKKLFTIICLLVLMHAATAHTSPASGGQEVSPVVPVVAEEFQLDLKIPVFSSDFSQFPIAVVNDEPIRMGDLTNALALSHEERTDTTKRTSKVDYPKILDRLINARLIAGEAVNIGLDELPEFQSMVRQFTYQTLASALRKEATKDLKPAPDEVEKLYQKIAVEWKIKSLLFEKEEDARQMAAALKAGQSFDQLAEKAVAEKKAKGGQPGEFMKPNDLLPSVFTELASMKTGSASRVIEVPYKKTKAFTILKLEDKRHPDSEEARRQAEQAVLSDLKSARLQKFRKTLFKKHAVIQESVLKGLNYDSSAKKSAQLQKLMKDKRAVATIRGEKPITVAELTEALRKKYYHGLDKAAGKKKLNAEKREVLYSLLDKRVMMKEAVARGLDKSEKYLTVLQDFRNSTLFELFVAKVISPNLEIMESDLRGYYEAHKAEYVYPEMVKLTGLPFGSKHDAEAALSNLEKGADISWVRNNANGIATVDENNKLSLDGRVLSMKMLPGGIKEAIAGARTGEFRLYPHTDGLFYVLWVQEITPAKQQPYEEVREAVSKKVFPEKFGVVLEDWFRKLRENSKVTIYLTNARETGMPDTITRR